ncbi:hypothetical protein P3S67_030876 [Capsicum chacoense]
MTCALLDVIISGSSTLACDRWVVFPRELGTVKLNLTGDAVLFLDAEIQWCIYFSENFSPKKANSKQAIKTPLDTFGTCVTLENSLA